jgi:hypothetical protein
MHGVTVVFPDISIIVGARPILFKHPDFGRAAICGHDSAHVVA